jgi:hypothetical protein
MLLPFASFSPYNLSSVLALAKLISRQFFSMLFWDLTTRSTFGLHLQVSYLYKRLKEELLRLGFRVSPFDFCIYINDDSKFIITVWVDDLRVYGPTV